MAHACASWPIACATFVPAGQTIHHQGTKAKPETWCLGVLVVNLPGLPILPFPLPKSPFPVGKSPSPVTKFQSRMGTSICPLPASKTTQETSPGRDSLVVCCAGKYQSRVGKYQSPASTYQSPDPTCLFQPGNTSFPPRLTKVTS